MKAVSIIIPCYNEEDSLPQLFEALRTLEGKLKERFDYHFIFVDDGSKDRTLAILEENRHLLGDVIIARHEKNSNLGAALKTGVARAPAGDYLCFLDSDCTYDPAIVLTLLEELERGADLVTVSPYHPRGCVEGVPAWRLLLSKGLSGIYRLVLLTDLFTFTAMVRGVRQEKMPTILGPSNDFSFVAECLIKAIKLRFRIVEVPTVLRVRKFGVSKMNIVKTIRSHLKILGRLLLRGNV